jgi:predicted porin
MKKTLIALAVAGSFVCGAAYAQSSNVTLYGRINLDLESVSSSSHSSLGRSQRLQSNASRIGVRGSEDLGGGLKAIFQVESAFNGDTGGGNLATRDTYVGLQGSWGSVRFGNMLMPEDAIHAIWGNAPTFTTSILNTEALWTQNPYGNLYIPNSSTLDGSKVKAWQFGQRWGQSVRYDSPNLNGLKFAIQVVPLDESGDKDDTSIAFGANAIYSNAGLQVGLGLEYVDWNGPNNVAADLTSGTAVHQHDSSDFNATLTGAYDFGFLRPALMVSYNSTKKSMTILNNRDFFDGNDSTNNWQYGLSLTAPLGAGKAYLGGVYSSKWKHTEDTAAWQAEVSYTYPLSKRTQVYAGYVFINNDDNASYSFATNGNGAAVGKDGKGIDQQGLILGMVHFF